MASPPFDNLAFEDISFSSLLEALDDDRNQLLQENGESPLTMDHNTSEKIDSCVFSEQKISVKTQLERMDKGFKARERSRRIRHIIEAEKMVVESGDEEEFVAAKKLDHNAKERIRRMKLNASYLALRSLLPNSRRSKKRWTAPVVIDKVLDYIPELENEIENLNIKKDDMQANVKKKQDLGQSSKTESQVFPTISVDEVTESEVIVQICTKSDRDNNKLSNLIQNVEGQGMSIASASTLVVCDDRVCYHLHIQRNGSGTSLGANYIAELRDNVLSWLS